MVSKTIIMLSAFMIPALTIGTFLLASESGDIIMFFGIIGFGFLMYVVHELFDKLFNHYKSKYKKPYANNWKGEINWEYKCYGYKAKTAKILFVVFASLMMLSFVVFLDSEIRADEFAGYNECVTMSFDKKIIQQTQIGLLESCPEPTNGLYTVETIVHDKPELKAEYVVYGIVFLIVAGICALARDHYSQKQFEVWEQISKYS